MNTNPNRKRRFAGIAALRRLLWLAPLIVALSGCGGGGSADPTATDAQGQPASSIPEPLTGRWETILTDVPAFYSGPYGDGDPLVGWRTRTR
jgi:hypothetical protein